MLTVLTHCPLGDVVVIFFKKCNFRTHVTDEIHEHFLSNFSQVNTRKHRWQVNIGSGNGSVPLGNNPLPDIGRHTASQWVDSVVAFSSWWRLQMENFPRNWPFVWGIHRSPVNYPHKGQWREALMFSLISVWINDWVNNREAGDLRRYRAHYDVTVMIGDAMNAYGLHIICVGIRIEYVHEREYWRCSVKVFTLINNNVVSVSVDLYFIHIHSAEN